MYSRANYWLLCEVESVRLMSMFAYKYNNYSIADFSPSVINLSVHLFVHDHVTILHTRPSTEDQGGASG